MSATRVLVLVVVLAATAGALATSAGATCFDDETNSAIGWFPKHPEDVSMSASNCAVADLLKLEDINTVFGEGDGEIHRWIGYNDRPPRIEKIINAFSGARSFIIKSHDASIGLEEEGMMIAFYPISMQGTSWWNDDMVWLVGRGWEYNPASQADDETEVTTISVQLHPNQVVWGVEFKQEGIENEVKPALHEDFMLIASWCDSNASSSWWGSYSTPENPYDGGATFVGTDGTQGHATTCEEVETIIDRLTCGQYDDEEEPRNHLIRDAVANSAVFSITGNEFNHLVCGVDCDGPVARVHGAWAFEGSAYALLEGDIYQSRFSLRRVDEGRRQRIDDVRVSLVASAGNYSLIELGFNSWGHGRQAQYRLIEVDKAGVSHETNRFGCGTRPDNWDAIVANTRSGFWPPSGSFDPNAYGRSAIEIVEEKSAPGARLPAMSCTDCADVILLNSGSIDAQVDDVLRDHYETLQAWVDPGRTCKVKEVIYPSRIDYAESAVQQIVWANQAHNEVHQSPTYPDEPLVVAMGVAPAPYPDQMNGICFRNDGAIPPNPICVGYYIDFDDDGCPDVPIEVVNSGDIDDVNTLISTTSDWNNGTFVESPARMLGLAGDRVRESTLSLTGPSNPYTAGTLFLIEGRYNASGVASNDVLLESWYDDFAGARTAAMSAFNQGVRDVYLLSNTANAMHLTAFLSDQPGDSFDVADFSKKQRIMLHAPSCDTAGDDPTMRPGIYSEFMYDNVDGTAVVGFSGALNGANYRAHEAYIYFLSEEVVNASEDAHLPFAIVAWRAARRVCELGTVYEDYARSINYFGAGALVRSGPAVLAANSTSSDFEAQVRVLALGSKELRLAVELGSWSKAVVGLYDVSGRLVTSKPVILTRSGLHHVPLPHRLAPGVYFAHAELQSRTRARRSWTVKTTLLQ